ncbi:MAG: hypothetical protein ABSD71_07870 [Bacteroidales bacterium]|jgi:hypothetical protein
MEKYGRIYKGFYINQENWEQLRLISVINHENVSVTLRRIIMDYLDENQYKIKGFIIKRSGTDRQLD